MHNLDVKHEWKKFKPIQYTTKRKNTISRKCNFNTTHLDATMTASTVQLKSKSRILQNITDFGRSPNERFKITVEMHSYVS